KVRESASRLKCQNNLKQVGLALHNYEGVRQAMPPSSVSVSYSAKYAALLPEFVGTDSSGNPTLAKHSWMGLILPYVEQGNVLLQNPGYDFKKNWNDPQNIPAAGNRVSVYECPSVPVGDHLFPVARMSASTKTTWTIGGVLIRPALADFTSINRG